MVQIINNDFSTSILSTVRNQQSELLGSAENTCDVVLHGLEMKILNGFRRVLTVPGMFPKS